MDAEDQDPPGKPTAGEPPAAGKPTERESGESDLASLLLAAYFVALIAIVAALLILPAIF